MPQLALVVFLIAACFAWPAYRIATTPTNGDDR